MLAYLIQTLERGRDLSDADIAGAVAALVDEQFSAETKADFLSALASKGETAAELAAFADQLRARSVVPVLAPATRAGELLDVCGTGGDRLHTFNISTTVALIAAAAGVPVAKHGNRAITSQAGSADVLEALGIRIDLSPVEAGRWLQEYHFAFFFAPLYHPAFKHIAPARRLCAQRGQRTLFNFLGPLLNPARPTAQLIGVPRPEWCEPLGRVLQRLGVRRGMVVSGAVGAAGSGEGAVAGRWLDELSILGDNTIAEFYQERAFSVTTFPPTALPLPSAQLSDLSGADRETNARILRAIVAGEDRGPRRAAVLLNAAAALFVVGRCRSLAEGWEQAESLIGSGAVQAKLETLVAASKRAP
jgi:anthranilate phosphoribosyltransferase